MHVSQHPTGGAARIDAGRGRFAVGGGGGDVRTRLRLAGVAEGVRTLGPSPSVVLWTQGCSIGCKGCMSRDTWSTTGGAVANVDDVVAWLERLPHRSLVLSGGEPTEQAHALNALLDRLTADWLVTLYSGSDWEELSTTPDIGIAELIGRVDLAIVGPYRRELHADLLWRGSSNQRIVDLSGRVDIPTDDRSAGVVVELRRDGVVAIGVPRGADFDRVLRRELATAGIALGSTSRSTFPFPVDTEEA